MKNSDFFEALLTRAKHDISRAMLQICISTAVLIAALIFALYNHGTGVEIRDAWASCGFVAAFIMSWFVVGGLTDIYLARETIKSVRCYRAHKSEKGM